MVGTRKCARLRQGMTTETAGSALITGWTPHRQLSLAVLRRLVPRSLRLSLGQAALVESFGGHPATGPRRPSAAISVRHAGGLREKSCKGAEAAFVPAPVPSADGTRSCLGE